MVIDCQTDNKARTLQALRLIIKDHGGTATPTNYMFSKRGRVVFESQACMSMNDVFDDAVEAGAEDIDVDKDGNITILVLLQIFTEPTKTVPVAAILSQRRGLKILSSNIIWDANEDTKVNLEVTRSLQGLLELIEDLQEDPSVQGIYINAAQGSIDDVAWAELQNRVAV
ncbi:MAG: hypothetical protein M1813_003102 [Trichoglossum hirsutum]|nr:MAG: hypothetical protein M1813_003102 [Trichoglossum hirsutum]